MRNPVHRLAGTALLGLALVLAAAGSTHAAEDSAPKRPAVGDPAPAFSLPSTTGTAFELAALRGKERAVVVFFRGSW